MLHDLMTYWFKLVLDYHYWAVGLLMAMESSIFPVPSEVVIPPAAYLASKGDLNFWGVVLAGTVGSYVGSAITYWVSYVMGRPFLNKFGKYFFFNEKKQAMAEAWVLSYGATGVFLARLLPVVRHLISIPSGVLKMPFLKFSVITTLGAGIWCYILAWFGMKVLGQNPNLINNPEEIVTTIKSEVQWFVFAVIGFTASYLYFIYLKNRALKKVNP